MVIRHRSRMMEIVVAAFAAVTLSVLISELPKFELVKAAMNDDNFTDLVLQTRGELPIDTSIRVVTFDGSILDSFDMVDRATLAMQLAALLELKPKVVGVDFLIETERPEAPEGDEMLAALIADHPNLIFGIFHEDSLKRFRLPPPRFNLRDSQLGCINLQEDDDRSIRTFTTLWGEDGSKKYESFDVKIARALDSGATRDLTSSEEKTFVIDYAAGIGETKREGGDGDRIFPVMPLRAIFEIVTSGDSAGTAALRREFQGKGVLVGYGDLRNSQVTSIVDRFYTPLKPEKNTLPDMHGVAIHANIVNTIVQERLVQIMPLWANILWGALLVMLMLIGRDYLQRIPNPTRRTTLTYTGFGIVFFLAALLPVLAFRYTPYKFSIFTPIAGLLLAVPTLEGLDKGIDLLRDLRRRRRLRAPLPPSMKRRLHEILRLWSVEDRLERAIHFLQIEFHTACAALFHEALHHGTIAFDPATIAAPTPRKMIAALDADGALATHGSRRAVRAAALLRALDAEPVLQRTLRLSRSLYVALNEIRRQSMEGMGYEGMAALERSELEKSVEGYADLALKTLSSRERGEGRQEFDDLYDALERYLFRAADILRRDDGTVDDLIPEADRLDPYLFPCRCSLHGMEERFVYMGMQEDANNRDDFFDLVYAGRTIRCQPAEHPGLTRFREVVERGGEGESG